MPLVPVELYTSGEILATAEDRWSRVHSERPDLAPALLLQRELLTIVIETAEAIERTRLPRLSLPAKYLAAKLKRGVPMLSGEPIPLPLSVLKSALLRLCDALATGGAGESASHIRHAIERSSVDAGSLLSASLSRDQDAVRAGSVQHGLAPDLTWLAAELAASPFVFALQRTMLAHRDDSLTAAFGDWIAGYCPMCGSWPALAEVVGGHRALRCSFCALAWELNTYSCIYCGEEREAFVTAAPNEERKDRRLELCSACHSYLKTIDVDRLSPFPLVAIADMETMDLDLAALEHGYGRPPLKDFVARR